jgi:NADPH-dependent ferric siderophore reductase
MSDDATPYRLFDLTLIRRRTLTHCLTRFTFTGPDMARMTTLSPDQRIKIFFPDAEGRAPDIPRRPDWYALWKGMPEGERPPMRTYTIRALRPEEGEVDVDFVLHGDTGPASRWAMRAQPGDAIQMTAPDRAFTGEGGGYEWRPPKGMNHALLIADETALPALAGILEELAAWPKPPMVEAFVEVPEEQDRMPLPSWRGLQLVWMPRDEWTNEEPPMVAAAHLARLPEQVGAEAGALPEVDIDSEVLWDRAAPDAGGFYAWVAGEAGSVLAIRQHLVRDRGLDRRTLNLMGYWRRGRVLD